MIRMLTFFVVVVLLCLFVNQKKNLSHTVRVEMPYVKGTAQAGFQNESIPFPRSHWQRFVNTVHSTLQSPNHIDLSQLQSDLQELKAMGGNSYRFSVEWARVSPNFYDFDISYYVSVCALLQSLELRPIITLFHFVLPDWATNVWTHKQPWFVKFSKKVICALCTFDPIWITLNEPFLYALHGYITGSRPPFRKSPKTGLIVLKNMLVDHCEIYQFCKHHDSKSIVGIAKNFMPVHADCVLNPFEQCLKYQFSNWFNQSFYNFLNTGHISFWLLGTYIRHNTHTFPVCDFVGVNHYTEMTFTTGITNPINVELRPQCLTYGSAYTKAGWYVTADSWFKTLESVCSEVNLPVIVTECGVSQIDQKEGITRRVVMQNILNTFNLFPQVQGVLVWTLIDNIEWESGNDVKFGIFDLTRKATEIYEPIKQFFQSH